MATISSPRTSEQRSVLARRPLRAGDWVVLALFILVPLLIGAVGSMVTAHQIDGWYASATKAPWNPPNQVFGPVWTVLYVVIGVAGWLVWRRRDLPWARPALTFYLAQLLLNAIWSPLFFGGQSVLGSTALWLAFLVILVLLGVVVATMLTFRRVSLAAAWLFVPYLLWLAYASTLNVYIAVAN